MPYKDKEKRKEYCRNVVYPKNKIKRRDYIIEYNKKWRLKNKDYYLKWKSLNREKLILKQKEWVLANKEKTLAHSIARKINIPENTLCQRCHINNAREKHHEDYSKPLEIIFCCSPCHYYLNRERKQKVVEAKL